MKIAKGYEDASEQLTRVRNKYIRTKPFGNSDRILLTVNPKNFIACRLYQGLGFTETGRSDEDEVELGLTLR